MANGIDLSALTMNPIEVKDLQDFIIERVYNRPEFQAIHGTLRQDLKMKEQIVFASQFGKTGLKGDSTCTRKSTPPESTATQKYWEPQGIEDTLVHCNKELDQLFKAYFGKITKYREEYEIEGSDLEIFFSILMEESMVATRWRAIWYADLNVAAAGAGTSGLVSAGDIPYYNYFDGLWEQIFDAVAAVTLNRYTIALNAQVTKAAQLALTADLAKDTYFEEVLKLADPRLKAHEDARMYVTGEIWENYRQSLQNSGENFTIEFTTEGFRQLKWNRYPIINMETIWDLETREDFVDNTTNNAYDNPNRIVFTIPENIPVGTLNDNDFNELETWYERKDRTNYIAYGFSLDSKLLEEYMAVVAY
jgi:hypothetical protein